MTPPPLSGPTAGRADNLRTAVTLPRTAAGAALAGSAVALAVAAQQVAICLTLGWTVSRAYPALFAGAVFAVLLAFGASFYRLRAAPPDRYPPPRVSLSHPRLWAAAGWSCYLLFGSIAGVAYQWGLSTALQASGHAGTRADIPVHAATETTGACFTVVVLLHLAVIAADTRHQAPRHPAPAPSPGAPGAFPTPPTFHSQPSIYPPPQQAPPTPPPHSTGSPPRSVPPPHPPGTPPTP